MGNAVGKGLEGSGITQDQPEHWGEPGACSACNCCCNSTPSSALPSSPPFFCSQFYFLSLPLFFLPPQVTMLPLFPPSLPTHSVLPPSRPPVCHKFFFLLIPLAPFLLPLETTALLPLQPLPHPTCWGVVSATPPGGSDPLSPCSSYRPSAFTLAHPA